MKFFNYLWIVSLLILVSTSFVSANTTIDSFSLFDVQDSSDYLFIVLFALFQLLGIYLIMLSNFKESGFIGGLILMVLGLILIFNELIMLFGVMLLLGGFVGFFI